MRNGSNIKQVIGGQSRVIFKILKTSRSMDLDESGLRKTKFTRISPDNQLSKCQCVPKWLIRTKLE